jgi:methylphosphotriester-DNA--protein-cysteine methyltransferase
MAKSDDARWAILSTRTCPPSLQPPWLYAVTTTHIYCRPTCPARLARRANVVFFDTASDAEKAGYRACKRCKPNVAAQADPGGREVVQAGDGEEGRRKVIKAVEIIKEKGAKGQRVGLRELSEEVGLSRWHLLRIFRKRWGVTPKEMADGVLNFDNRNAGKSGQRTPDTVITNSTKSASSTSSGMPMTPETDISSHDEQAGADFDNAFMDFDLMDLDVNLAPVEFWSDGASGEDVLRDLFPEVYQQEAAIGH